MYALNKQNRLRGTLIAAKMEDKKHPFVWIAPLMFACHLSTGSKVSLIGWLHCTACSLFKLGQF